MCFYKLTVEFDDAEQLEEEAEENDEETEEFCLEDLED